MRQRTPFRGRLGHPVRFARCHEDMRRKGFDFAVDLAFGLDVKLARVLHGAVCAVAETVWAVFLRVNTWEHILGVAAADARREPRLEHVGYIL